LFKNWNDAKLLSMSANRLPVLFLAHGAPPLLDDKQWLTELTAWGAALPRPRAILMLSAHWEESPLRIGATQPVPLVYDFYGFPKRFYDVKYPSPGAPALAARVRDLLDAAAVAHVDDPTRGLDHGVFIPMTAMWPNADVPVLQISLPALDPARLLRLGEILAPLRHEGVLIVGSGFLTHNLRLGLAPTANWAREFDAWVGEAIGRRDLDALANFQTRGPGAKLAHPTWEHYAPLLIAMGASQDGTGAVKFPIEGWWMGSSMTKRSVELG